MNLKILVGLFILGIIILSAMTFLNFTSTEDNYHDVW
jgi:hypothetical protein